MADTVCKNPLEGMTQAKWDALSVSQREAIRDYSGLTKQLLACEGWRVEVVDHELSGGMTRRFIVGRSTGWRPCHLEISRRNARGGGCACKSYQSVRKLYKVR